MKCDWFCVCKCIILRVKWLKIIEPGRSLIQSRRDLILSSGDFSASRGDIILYSIICCKSSSSYNYYYNDVHISDMISMTISTTVIEVDINCTVFDSNRCSSPLTVSSLYQKRYILEMMATTTYISLKSAMIDSFSKCSIHLCRITR